MMASASISKVFFRSTLSTWATNAKWPWPRLKTRKTSSNVSSSSTIWMPRWKMDKSCESGVSSSGSTKIKSLTKSSPTMLARSPLNTGTREKPCSKISRTTLKESCVDSGSIYTSSSGVMTLTTILSFISRAPRMTFPDSSSSSPAMTWTFMYCIISFLECTVPTSSPSSLSSPQPKGTAIGPRTMRKKRTIGSVVAPTYKA
mmetsp:Transcript_21452/g.72714  ORF Transcript_21452/g.72714 Transcript_21452/m.72714 type:complete len:202 (-) Transcript_21452:462-1067(-)